MDIVTEDYVNSLFPASRAILRNHLITHDVRIRKGRGYAAQRMLLRMIDQADDQHDAIAHLPERTDGANAPNPNGILQIAPIGASGRHNTMENLPDSIQNENPISGTSNELAGAAYFTRIAAQNARDGFENLQNRTVVTRSRNREQDYETPRAVPDTSELSGCPPPALDPVASSGAPGLRMRSAGIAAYNNTSPGQLLANIAKLYPVDERYSGIPIGRRECEIYLFAIESQFGRTMKVFNITDSDLQIEAKRHILRGAALTLFSSMIVPKIGTSIRTAENVFSLLRATFVSEAHQKSALTEFRTLTFEKIQISLLERHTLEAILQVLYERAMHLHQMLPSSYSNDAHLRDMLLRATECCSFVSHLPENEPSSSYDVNQMLCKAISKYKTLQYSQEHEILEAEYQTRYFKDRSRVTKPQKSRGTSARNNTELAFRSPKGGLRIHRSANRGNGNCFKCNKPRHHIRECPEASTSDVVHYLSVLYWISIEGNLHVCTVIRSRRRFSCLRKS
jgi:hypothetical protein